MLLLRMMCLLGLLAVDVNASSHWIVTETGIIQTKQDSPFLMVRPSDLIAFLNQDIRWHNTFAMYNDLYERQIVINSLWAELKKQAVISTSVDANVECNSAGDILKMNWYNTFMEDGTALGIPESEFKLDMLDFGATDVPDCKKISSLTYSMSTFEHLESLVHRAEFNGTPETILPKVFTPSRSLDQYGHWLSDILRKNTSSWLHYNLAAIFWRLKGNVPKALECSRRAVHHAPRKYKSIPLLCMGSILHRIERTKDAVVVLRAAVDHFPKFPLSHITLGEAYALLGEFNNSVKHFNISMKLHYNAELALTYRSAVMCLIDMFIKIHNSQSTMQALRDELRAFYEIENQWFQTHGALLMNMHHEKDYDYKSIENNCKKIEEITKLNIKELLSDRDRNHYIMFLVNKPEYAENWLRQKGVDAFSTAYDFETAVKQTNEQAGPVNPNFMGFTTDNLSPRNKTEFQKVIGPPLPIFPDNTILDLKKFPSQIKAEIKIPIAFPDLNMEEHSDLAKLKKADNGKALYPTNMRVNRNKEAFDTDPDWPSMSFCQSFRTDPPDKLDAVYPMFLPFEHKGLSLKTLLTDRIGVPALVEHELPWHPPLCPTDKELNYHTSKKPDVRVQVVSESIGLAALRKKLHMYVGQDKYELMKNKEDAEIGQRIHTAIQKKLASKWVLFTLASLYWRVRGHTHNALNCLLTASRSTDTRYRDIVLVSLASVFLEMGLLDDALITAEEAYQINPYEPPTNFLLAQLHLLRRQRSAQFLHMKQVLRVEPGFLGGQARDLLNAWACVHKHMALKDMGDLAEDGNDRFFCTETEPGMSMMCEGDGTNCHFTNRNCAAETIDGVRLTDDTALSHLLELREIALRKKFPLKFLIQTSTFNKYLETVPTERDDYAGHQKSFEMMIETLAANVATCPNNECGVGEDMDQLEKCSFDKMQTDYWFLHVCLPQELLEADKQMMSDASWQPPYPRNVPDCSVPLNSQNDFFIKRILAVDSENWSPNFDLMQRLIMLYKLEFVTIGAKIASYIEAHPRSWHGIALAVWWCGAAGHGACAVRCAAEAHALAPAHHAHLALRPLIASLHMQSKMEDAMEIAYLSFYSAPKNLIEAVILGYTHKFRGNPNEAIWLYRYALAFDSSYLPANAALLITVCENKNGNSQRKAQRRT